jgi:hypothetical protein
MKNGEKICCLEMDALKKLVGNQFEIDEIWELLTLILKELFYILKRLTWVSFRGWTFTFF